MRLPHHAEGIVALAHASRSMAVITSLDAVGKLHRLLRDALAQATNCWLLVAKMITIALILDLVWQSALEDVACA